MLSYSGDKANLHKYLKYRVIKPQQIVKTSSIGNDCVNSVHRRQEGVNSKMLITDNRRCTRSELNCMMGGEKGRNEVGDEGNIDQKDVR